jgi:hypothetical protein
MKIAHVPKTAATESVNHEKLCGYEKSIEIDLKRTGLFEAGAVLVAVLALPSGDEVSRGSLVTSLCHLILKGVFLANGEDGASNQPIKPIYAFRTESELKRDLKILQRLLRDRMIAAQMALPLLMRAEGFLPSKLPEGLSKLTLDELAVWAITKVPELAEADSPMESSNIETRIWRPSLPVIHIAAAVAVTMQEAARDGRGKIEIGHLLTHRWIVEQVIDRSVQYAKLIEAGNVLPGKPIALIKIRLISH